MSETRTPGRGMVLLAIVVVLGSSTGCSALGLGIGAAAGAATPRYEKVDTQGTLPTSGTRVRVLASRGAAGLDQWFEGSYGGVKDGALIVTGGDESDECFSDCKIPLESVRDIRVRNGTQWVSGMVTGVAIGAALDLAALVTVATLAKSGCCGPK